MRLTSKGEYGLLALVFLARQEREKVFSVASIAKEQQIPVKFLEQILLTLKRAGYVESIRGSGGGYRLAEKPQKITLAEIVRLFDGAIAPTSSTSKFFYQSSPIEREPKLLETFRRVRDTVAKMLESITLKDII